mmetsp:Transcript_27481/g.69953  ORF Transcript_27481/g.69953 Transcript_27481/m.69953 type:complete len:214 (+) Transcript_27481:401-1042(+)
MAQSCDTQALAATGWLPGKMSCSYNTVRSTSLSSLVKRAMRATRCTSNRNRTAPADSRVSAPAKRSARCPVRDVPIAVATNRADRDSDVSGLATSGATPRLPDGLQLLECNAQRISDVRCGKVSSIGHSLSISQGTQVRPAPQHWDTCTLSLRLDIMPAARRSHPSGALKILPRATAKEPIGEKDVNSTSKNKSRPLLRCSYSGFRQSKWRGN